MHERGQFELSLTAMVEQSRVHSSLYPCVSPIVEDSNDMLLMLHSLAVDSQSFQAFPSELRSSQLTPHLESDLTVPQSVNSGEPGLENSAEHNLVDEGLFSAI